MDGLYGKDPDESSAYPGGAYEEGYLVGCEDRSKLLVGTKVPGYLGPQVESELPVRRGMEVTILKGTEVKVVGKPLRLAGKTYKIKVDHVAVGSCFYVTEDWKGKVYHRPEPTQVVWAGPGGYWSRSNLSDIPEAK
jgi:hypothetical protein